jgi:hypothetical protein
MLISALLSFPMYARISIFDMGENIFIILTGRCCSILKRIFSEYADQYA